MVSFLCRCSVFEAGRWQKKK